MKAYRRLPYSRSGYTLIEVLVAMSILSMAIGAASQLSLSQATTEELIERETHAVNYAENAARLWQLGIDNPQNILLSSPNVDGTLMSVGFDSNLSSVDTFQTPSNINAGEDYSTNPINVDATHVVVFWRPPGASADSRISFQVTRAKADRL